MLFRIHDIRTLHCMDLKGSGLIDFDFEGSVSHEKQHKPQPDGHAVAYRITGENSDTSFKSGRAP